MKSSIGCVERRLRQAALAVCLLTSVPLASMTAGAQRSNVAAIVARLRDPRTLLPAEARELVQATREGLGYRTLRLSASPGQPGVEILMGSDGRPLLVRGQEGDVAPGASRRPRPERPGSEPESITITEYTRRAARRCPDTLTPDELVVEYRSTGSGWTATARFLTAREFATPIFEMLAGEIPLHDDGQRQVTGRQTRDLTAPWSPPVLQTGSRSGGPTQGLVAPPASTTGVATARLSIDEETLLPLRWALEVPPRHPLPASTPAYERYFAYDAALTLAVPMGVAAPTCVP